MEDLPIYQYFAPPQTTVSQPMAELARLAVEKVLELCEARRLGRNPHTEPEVIDLCLPSTLIERDSVATISTTGTS